MDKLLRQFLEIADTGSVSMAAARLNVSQPGLSFNMRKLETELGVPLFIRSSRGMTLSEYGGILVNHVRIMDRLDSNARASITAHKLRREGGLRIGCGHAWWTLFLKDLVMDHGERFPNAPVSIDVGSQFSCMDHLLSGDTVAFVGHRIEGLGQHIGAAFEPLFSVCDALFVREAHPLVGTVCGEVDISRYGVVDSVPIESKYQQMVDASVAPGPSPLSFQPVQPVFEANSLLACVDFVLSSDSVMTYPAVMAGYFSRFGLVPLTLADMPPLKPIGIYVLGERKNDPEVRRTIEDIQERAERWVASCSESETGVSKAAIVQT